MGRAMRLSIDVRLDYGIAGDADVLLQIEAAAMADQTIESESLTLWSDSPIRAVRGEDGIGQRCWSRGHGRFTAEYKAIVAVKRERVQLELYPATPPRMLDGELTPYLMPSRYCPSDRFEGFVAREFGGLEGGPLAAALTEWVYQSLDYRCGSSSGETTALDTFASRSGVCRDYSHLLVSLARAAGSLRGACRPMRRGSIRPISTRSRSCGWRGTGG